MDRKLTLTTDNEGKAIASNIEVKGELTAFIISNLNPFPMGVRISSNLGYDLLDLKYFAGVKYLPPSVQRVGANGEMANYSNTCYYLDETINIEVNGPKNQEITIIVRIENG